MNIPTKEQLLQQYPQIRFITNREYGYFTRILKDPQNASVPNVVERALVKVTADRERESQRFTLETTSA